MKKRVLSAFMALALCLTLLPTAALADELGPVDGTSTVETAGADAEAEAKAKADAEAAASVQAQIDALPSLGELKGMDSDTLNEAYMAVQSAYDAYEALSEEQQAQVSVEKLMALLGCFSSQVAPLADKVTDIWLDGVDLKTGEMTQGTQTWEAVPLENRNGDLTLTGGNMYVVGANQEVTIDGDLTMAGNSQNYLILFNGAKLIINGALILERNGLNIYSHTESQTLDTIGQITINNSKEPSGAAIRSSAGSALTLNLYGGKLTAKGGEYGAVSNVYLNRNDRPLKATLGGELLSPADWAFTAVNSPANKDLVIEWCKHEDNEKLSYVDNKDNATHHMKCDLCGFEWLAANGASDNYSKINHTCIYTDLGDNGHKGTCVECKAVIEEEHSGSSSIGITITSDNRQHITGGCDKCGHGGTAENHTYNVSGECEVCGFTPVATTVVDDSGKDTGKLYESIEDAIKSGATELWLVSYEKDPATDKYTNTLRKTLEIEAGVTLTLHMNGVKLEGTAGSPALTVSGGTLTVQGEADLVSQNITASSENPAPAIEVTGGSLVFEGGLTAQGGKSSSAASPAIEATGGTVEFKGALNLDGGLFLNDCARLASKLTQGSFYSDNNDQGQVYRVQIENDSQHSYDLLADGYAFAKYDESAENKAGAIVNGSVKQLTEDVIVVSHTHSIAEGQSACACGRQFEASVTAEGGTTAYYGTLDEAFAHVKANETVKLMIDSDDRDRQDYIYVVGGPYTFDLNGHRVGHRTDDDNRHQAFLQVGDPDGSPGKLTVLDSSKTDDTEGTGYFYELKLYNGSLTVESGSFYRYWESASTATGTMTFKGGTVDVFTVTSRNVETKISGGTFGLVENNIDGKPGDLLADNRAFFNRNNNNNFVNGYDDKYQAVRDVVVKEHTHHIVNGSCECGFTCAHDWSDKNGVCPICGYHCPHNAGATETDGVWACDVCGQTVTAKVVAPDGAITYYADGYLDNGHEKSGLYFAVQAAKTGSTVTMLGGGCMAGCFVRGGITLTLDVSNGKTIDGTLNVGYTNPDDKGNTLIVRGGAEISYVIVDPGNNLDLTDWTGRIGSLTVLNGGKAKLNGGTFAKLNVNGAAVGPLLASGYALQYVDSGAYVECSSTDNMENVRVVKCPHSDVTPKGDLTGVKCKYCGADFAATLDDAPYDTIDAAVSAWLQKGGTLKLYADYTTADGTWSIGSGSHTINLNKHRMSVQDGGAFKPTNNMHLTVIDGTEIGQIENILLDGGSFTMESGYVGNLKMTGGAVVALKGGSVDELDVQNCSANTNLSIQGGSLGKLNIKDWADGMHVSATGGSLGAYSLPSGKILADVLDHQYYAEGTSLDRQVHTAQKPEKFVIKQAPYDFGSNPKEAEVPINGRIPFRVDSPSENVGVYLVKWYRRTNSGAVHMTENKVAGVNVGDTLDVFCVITGVDRPNNGTVLWQVAVKGYKLTVTPADLSQGAVVFTQTAEEFAGTMGNIGDGKGTFVFTPWGGNADSPSELSYLFKVTYNGQPLKLGEDYTIKGSSNRARNAGTHTLTIEGKGNYTGTATHTWRIEPYKLTRGNYSPPTITKVYDGTTGFDFSRDSNWGSFKENVANRPNAEGTGKNPALGGDTNAISIYLKPEDLKASAVTLDSPDAGDRTASYTITLKARDGQSEPNFAFEDDELPTIQVTAKASITKAPAPTGLANGALTVYNGTAKTYEIDIASLLPSPGAGCRYGEIYDSQTIGFETYKTEITEIKLDSSYYDKTADKAKIEKGKLILPIRNVNTTTTGKIGTIKLNVISQNYHQIQDWTIDVSAANQPVSSSGGGGGSSSGGTVKTDTVTNPDGSVTKTETKSDGTVVETTTGKDGSTTKTETKKDGSSVTENKAADGSTGTVKTDKNGQTEANAKISDKAVSDAKNSGDAVKVPTEVRAGTNSNSAPTVKIELPRNSGDTKVEIPVTNVKPGTVAVIVHPDGTEEIVKNSLPTEDGIQLTVNGGATVKIVDNAKDFIDTQNHWAKDAINFVSARELVNGMSATIYAPDASATRAQMWTILARQNDADLSGGANWYEKAQLWSKDKGVSDGTNPNGTINRAQMVTMLWRTMGQPAAGGSASFADVPADSYYAQAVAWAIENGITAGVGGGRFDPNATCTRAQIATFLYRTYQGK